MPLFMAAFRRSTAKHRYCWLVASCMAAMFLAARQMTMGPFHLKPLSNRANRPLGQTENFSKTISQPASNSELWNRKLLGMKPAPYWGTMQGWFVLPESLIEKLEVDRLKRKGSELKTPGNNEFADTYGMEKLLQNLQAYEGLHSEESAGREGKAPEKVIIQMLMARETIDCLLQRAISQDYHALPPCYHTRHPSSDLPNKNPSDRARMERRSNGTNTVLAKVCPPCPVTETDKRDLGLTEGVFVDQQEQGRPHLVTLLETERSSRRNMLF